jgi:hypothetical protein
MQPDPIPKYLVLKNLLDKEDDDDEVIQCKKEMLKTSIVKKLIDSQKSDGSWGRFHSQDSSIKTEFPTTEYAISLALDIGLDKSSSILQKTVDYLVSHINGKIEWIDPSEKHDNPEAWPIETKHYSAAALALIDNENKELFKYRDYWETIVSQSFASGEYSRETEREIRIKLDGCIRKKPIPFDVRHPLIILSSTNKKLNVDLQNNILHHVMENDNGIYYVYPNRISAIERINDKNIFNWIKAQMILSRFDEWNERAISMLKWLWNKSNQSGLWDFGINVPRRPYSCFPLSESWKKGKDRIIDQSTIVLTLLKRMYK